MRSIVLGLLVLMVMATGCATAGNTPAQELAWERWGACNHFSTITLDRVDQDGRIVVTGYQVDGASFVSSANQNPTLTILAITMRACDYLAEEMKRGEL